MDIVAFVPTSPLPDWVERAASAGSAPRPPAPPAFGDASGGAAAELMACSMLRRYKAGQAILVEGEMAEYVGVVVSGVLKVTRTFGSDRQQIVSLLFSGSFFGRAYEAVSHFSVEAASDVEVRCIRRHDFEAVLERHPDFQQYMLSIALDELEAARDWMVLLGCQETLERVACFFALLLQRGEGQSQNTVTFPIGRRDIAGYLGTTVETLSRHVQLLSRQGVIQILDGKSFRILDYDRLHSLSGA